MESIIPTHTLAHEHGRPISFERITIADGEVRNSVHRHDYHELFVFASGSGTHMIDLTPQDVVAPSAHVVRGGQVHHLVRSGDMEGFVVMFAPSTLGEPMRRQDAQEVFLGMDQALGLPLDTYKLGILSDLAAMLEGEHGDGDDAQIHVQESFLGIMLAKCARWWRERMPDENARDAVQTDLIQRFRTLVEAHYLELEQVREYADKLRVTPGHLNDVVRTRLGSTASSLIDARRLLEAKRLLLHGTLSVKESGYAIGVKDPAYFTRWFKKLEGVSPVEYRTSVRDRYK
ncbi:MAG: helix-turn-helix domain-containing protein [Flavobacteriales bacterium]|nr:helix-turn-helix domain-containing protein [Flavobacteriales bacterium]